MTDQDFDTLPRMATAKELAEYIGCELGNIYRWIDAKELEAVNVGRHKETGRPKWAISRASVVRFMQSRSSIAESEELKTKKETKRRRNQKMQGVPDYFAS